MERNYNLQPFHEGDNMISDI